MADLNDVLKTLIAEGIGEGPEGMRRIGEVILNRAAITGQTPEQIVRESGQFTGFKHPGSATRRAMSDPAAVAKAEAAWNLAQQPGDPTNGANFYHTPAVNPSWDNHMTNKGQYGNHIFYADRPIPPGEIPNAVGTLTDTVPPRAPTPVTPSIDMSMMRSRPPTNLISDSFASLPKPSGATLGDSLGMNPIQGGKQTLPQFDAGYDEGRGVMRMFASPDAQTPPQMPRPRPQTAPPDLISRSMQAVASANPTRLPPIPPSTLGQPPATRVVQSVPMPAPARVAAPFVPEPRYIEPRNLVAAGLQPNGSIVPNKGQERLAAGLPLAPANYGGVANVALPPIPHDTIARAPLPAPPYRAVASELSTAPMPAMPRPRPNLGMGGVDISAAISQTGQVAPTPMPRLDRGGIFGKPQIAGHDVPLPGLFGLLQGITKGMNNASGPFSNGGENALYQMMRGGNQSRPSTATAQAGGFLYAPNPNGGGLVNVGRAPTYQNPDRFGQGGTTNGAVQPRGTLF